MYYKNVSNCILWNVGRSTLKKKEIDFVKIKNKMDALKFDKKHKYNGAYIISKSSICASN